MNKYNDNDRGKMSTTSAYFIVTRPGTRTLKQEVGEKE